MSKKSKRRVIIIGGGYAGINIARPLDDHADVTLVEPRDNFVHNVAAIRSLVQPDLLETLLIPYDRLLKNGAVVKGKATQLDGTNVQLQDGRILEGDVIVVATGAGYASPFKAATDSIADFKTAQQEASTAIKQAQSIAIAGGGPVGIELAGEIAHVHPDKGVTLISAAPSLLPEYNPRLGKRLAKDLARLGIDVKLDTLATDLPQTTAPFGPATLSLSDGSSMSVDAIFPAIGSKPDGSLLQNTAGVEFDKLGRVLTDPWLRLPNQSNVFVLGDAVSTGDAMTIVAITRQAPWLTKTIRHLLGGKAVEKMKPYTPWPTPPLLVPVGPNKGASVLPLGRNGLVVGSFITSQMKGRDLFMSRYLKEFGY